MNLTSDTILANKYKLVRPLGEGGMGCVWVADHLHLDRQVAIKVISNRVISDPTVRDRFETEARATAKVESPHVVQVLDFDYTEAGQPFLVLELLVGETLEQRLSREGVLSITDARELLKQTTHALEEAHRAGILHRDIKADNLFVVARDELFVKLLDFGIAIRSDRASRPDSAGDPSELSPIGTPLYMSPEQTLALGNIDERSDLYSLAVCMYYALTGDFPYCADTLAVLAFAQQREDFALPSTRRKELGPAIDAFFLRALAFHPEERFSSAEKMFRAFEKACERQTEARSDAQTMRPGVVKSLSASMRAESSPRRRTSYRGTVAVLSGAMVAASFFLIPRGLLPAAPSAVSDAAAFVASRIPTAQVSAAMEPSPHFTIERAQIETRASMLVLPLPSFVAARSHVAANMVALAKPVAKTVSTDVVERPPWPAVAASSTPEVPTADVGSATIAPSDDAPTINPAP